MPVLYAPSHCYMIYKGPTMPTPRTFVKLNKFSEDQIKEYLKTAKAVEQYPWTMDRAAAYLRKMIKNNTTWGLPEGADPHTLATKFD
eukprot:11999080-Alexandrium_andersonii.AAC.1